MKMEPDDLKRVWRFMVQTEQLGDGTWRASYLGVEWSVTGASEEEAEEKAAQEAIRRREDPDEVVRKTPRPPVKLAPDDPRRGRAWQFAPQTEQLGDGTWRAWFPSGGWSVTAAAEDEAKDKANREWFRRREDPDEIARRVATMRRHLVEPVLGVSMLDKSVLESAWRSDNPVQAVQRLFEERGGEPPRD
jgi:hypothetical protein